MEAAGFIAKDLRELDLPMQWRHRLIAATKLLDDPLQFIPAGSVRPPLLYLAPVLAA